MQKRKYELEKYADMHTEHEFAGADGTTVTVRNHIPYAEKEAMATEIAERMIMIHDDSCVYMSHLFDKFEKYMVAKYYTDIDTDGADENDVADFLINNNLFTDIEDFIYLDLDEVRSMVAALNRSVTKTYEDDRCLTKAIRTSFGFLFTGEDVTESLAKAEAMKDTMFDAVNALRKADQERRSKIDHGKLSLGGNVISFAKKTE